MNIFFGDSITAGENNNNISFADYVEGDNLNLGISGTTIGEYSIYPVDGNSLISVIRRNQDIIKKANKIFIEYGCNDVASIMCGFATVQTVSVSFVKAIDWIRQLNPFCEIYFLALGCEDAISTFAKNECNYLENDYFFKFDFKFPASVFSEIYSKILINIDKICDIIYMFNGEISNDWLSDDGIHPNTAGHIEIASNL